MVEPVLKALVQLFALIGDVHDVSVISIRERDIIRLFLSRQLNNEMVNKYMELFDEYFRQYSPQNITRGSLKDMKRTSLTAVKILGICEKINEELGQRQKVYVLVQLLDFILFGAEISSNAQEFLETVAIAFNIPQGEFRNIRNFILSSVNEIPDKKRVMIIDSKADSEYEGAKHLYKANLNNTIFFLQIETTNSYIFKYTGKEDIFLNGQNIFPDQTYTFDHGSTIRTSSGKSSIYYNDVSSVFSKEIFKLKVSLDAIDVNLRFKNSDSGIQNFNFHEESGTLVGIMGGSGVGKTTLLNVLSGVAEPQSGQILINGYDLYSEEGKKHLNGVIGFVPQDDLLIEELTVYQNLYYSSKMCLDNLPEDKLAEVVNKTLSELELNEIKDLKVGNSLNKVISGGQRKRLNIALELIREPTILFVDEPTSGLSSVDSETVMTLLKEQTDRGKLILVNIHQPGSDIYKMFDKIMIIDKGGYQIFYGNPSEAIVYFKSRASYANANEDQCVTCGNVNSDQLLQIIEAKVINENGKQTRIRRVSAKEWAEKFNDCSAKMNQKFAYEKHMLPENYFSIPGLIKQSKIFFIRDTLSKMANRQYVMIGLLGAPLLSLLLSYFTKYTTGSEYVFSENENIISYLFMCIITSLFLGLIISAEEIVKDRKILKRETFLNLSWFSYLNSKVMIMFLISAIQTISFILIGNFILEVKGMTLSYWLVLFTTSCLANLIGLNISSAFTSVITIYILIPFILIPQLLFSGVIVPFDKLHKSSISSNEFVPLIGDMMATRWSYEALATEQFKNNRYEKNFFRYDMEISQNGWYSFFLIPALNADIRVCLKHKDDLSWRQTVNENFYKLAYYINKLSDLAGGETVPVNLIESMNVANFNQAAAEDAQRYLDRLDGIFKKIRNENIALKDSASAVIGVDRLVELKDDYFNKNVENIINKPVVKQNIETDTRIIQKSDPGYMKPTAMYGRAHFYAPYKQLGNLKIDTFWFNILVLWIVTLAMYVALYYKLLQKFINIFEKMKFLRAIKKEQLLKPFFNSLWTKTG